ncbi:beta-galactosidase 17-like isoform X1 [Chenopodium quinoa]|uniref:beta-galactosidase 17-like isoform X1 n=1 Tax=Chenopodium quinoa TaxID=63459 RepID=UPI000B78D586|nr:beta-galactosidase 17-like isoform X1 [Chenopodium quinoa]
MRDHLPPSTMKNKGRFFFSTINSTLIFSLLAFLALFAFVAPLPSLSSHSPSHHRHRKKLNIRKFEIADDKFWKDGEPFRIIGGDLHYFRVLPEYWEDRLLRAKALGLNTIQTYVPWNLHEPSPGDLKFNGIADIVSFLKLCQKLGFFVMLRPGPYICAEWDLGGFPAWLLATEPTLRLRSSDPMYLELVDKWWGILLPVVAPLLYGNGGPIIMVQIENEYGSYADDKAYLHHLVKLARRHLGDDIILYTTDGGTRVTLKKGTILGDNVYSAVDFTTGDQPWPIFKLQKEFNAPGKSPPLSSEFYTGWLTHWGEKLAKTDADFTAAELEKILLRNGSVVLYMAHGGTNFGFYNGANTGSDDSDYKPDLTSYDYDAPIRETGDVDNAKFRAIRKVIEKYTVASLPPIPANNEKAGYGFVKLEKTSKLFDIIGIQDDANVVESVNPISMESVGQMHGFLLYISEFSKRDSASTLSISKVHDRAQVFVSCHSKDQGRPIYAGIIERWSNKELKLPHLKCVSKISLFVLVENMGRINYGPYISDRKGILSPVYVDGRVLHNWKMFSIPLHNLNDQSSSIIQLAGNDLSTVHAGKRMQDQSKNISNEPAFYTGSFTINSANQVKDTFLSVDGWGKGLAFINNFNLGRYWPTFGPQCNLYVPAPLLRHGSNTVVLFELDSPNTDLAVRFVQHEDFSCSQTSSNILEI